MEYFEWLTNNICYIEGAIEMILHLMEGAVLIAGISFFKTFKEKKSIATFTFWSQLCTRLIKISGFLENENGIVNNMYKDKDEWENELTPETGRLKMFKKMALDLLVFIENASDQIPAYCGWTDDYDIIKDFLTDIKIYDICDSQKYFRYINGETVLDRNNNIQTVVNAIKRMCTNIRNEQKKIEKKLCKRSLLK